MCNVIKDNGVKCKLSRKKDLCHKHVKHNNKIVTEVVVEEKIEEKVVEIKSETESSSCDFDDVTDDEDEVIIPVAESPVKAVVKPVATDCEKWLKANATGAYYVEQRLLEKDTKHYLHEVKAATVIRVKFSDVNRVFYWFYNEDDAIKFSEYVGQKLKLEPHNLICAPRCRLFFDIDMKLTADDLEDMATYYGSDLTDNVEMMDKTAMQLAHLYIDGLKTSLEENGADESDISQIDWMLTTRNRAVGDMFKVSLHIRQMINQDFMILNDTPLLDKLLRYQFVAEKDIEMLYFLIGRTLTEIHDNFQFCILLFGTAGCGKSVLQKLVELSYAQKKRAYFSATQQKTFGLADWYDKDILLSDDLPINMAQILAKSDYLSITSRGSVNVPIKGKDSVTISDWKQPIIFNSNTFPNNKDEKNEIMRRTIVVEFRNDVEKKDCDTELFNKIIASGEYPTFLHRCRSTYLQMAEQNKGRKIHSFLPVSYLESQTLLRKNINDSYTFALARVEYDQNSEISKKGLTLIYRRWIRDTYKQDKMSKATLNEKEVLRFDERNQFKNQYTCKSCRKHHLAGCCLKYTSTNRTKTGTFIGVSIKFIPEE